MADSATNITPDDEAEGFSAAERAAMKERARETRKRSKKDPLADLLEKIAEMPDADRVLAEGVHATVTAIAPDLSAKTWYGMPAYARDGKIVVFFQAAAKFDARYATLGFNDTANLDDGALWPTAFALKEWTPEVEQQVAALVKRAIS
jgi:uncharacterized protein YdhG (YjbR/CyaY superfamily)